MPYAISKTFEFSAAHSLPNLPETHKCHRLHGHNYKVTLWLSKEGLDEHGFVLDYAELDSAKKWIDDHWDHRNLNDKMDCQTTAENIARTLFNIFNEWWPSLYKVTVQETEKTSAEYWR